MDLILTPSQYQDSASYSAWVQGKVPLKVKARDGKFVDGTGSCEECNEVGTLAAPHAPLPAQAMSQAQSPDSHVRIARLLFFGASSDPPPPRVLF